MEMCINKRYMHMHFKLHIEMMLELLLKQDYSLNFELLLKPQQVSNIYLNEEEEAFFPQSKPNGAAWEKRRCFYEKLANTFFKGDCSQLDCCLLPAK